MDTVNYNYIHSIEDIFTAIELLETIRSKYENKVTGIKLTYGFSELYQQDELLVEYGKLSRNLTKILQS